MADGHETENNQNNSNLTQPKPLEDAPLEAKVALPPQNLATDSKQRAAEPEIQSRHPFSDLLVVIRTKWAGWRQKRRTRENAKFTDLVIMWATIVIAVAAVIQVWEIIDSGRQTDKIIAADERVAAAMEGAVGLGNTSLQATQNSFRDDQRAWLAPVSGTTTLDEAHALRVDVIYTNLGKTPALEVTTILGWKSIPAGQPIQIAYGPLIKRVNSGTMYPNGKAGMFAKTDAVPSKHELDAIQSGRTVFYFFGSIDYKDVFGRKHWSHLCNVVYPDHSGVRPCDTYNDAN